MSEDNPFRSPKELPDSDSTNWSLRWPKVIYWIATACSIYLGFSTIGCVREASQEAWAAESTGKVVACVVGSVLCAVVAVRVKRWEMDRE